MAKIAEKVNSPKADLAKAAVAKVAAPKLVTASARRLRISPRKMRLVTNLIKDLRAEEAITQLTFTNKKAAGMLAKLLKSAVANAENNFSMNPDQLFVKSVTCDMGQTMKRYFPRARGSAFTIRRKLAHVDIVLEQRSEKKVKKSRLSLLKRVVKPEAKPSTQPGVPESVEAKDEIAEKQQPNPAPVPKASEQRKANVIGQKRRLFSRKTGE